MMVANRSVLPEGTRRDGLRRTLCLVTVHGVGINQARNGNRIGYADQLHARLRDKLAGLLSREPDDPALEGPLYIEAEPNNLHALQRLGDDRRPLASPGSRIAHVALVYTDLDATGFDGGALLRGFARILFNILSYASPRALLTHGVTDLAAILTHRGSDASNPHPSLRVSRTTLDRGVTRVVPLRMLDQRHDPASGLLVLLRQLVDDFLAYLCRPRVRDGIVDFIQEALVQIADRDDIGAIVLNTHSQGTVAIFDALTDLDSAQPAARVARVRTKVIWLITAGSPLRKVIDLFGWRPLLRNFDAGWTNFWDRRDPAADPLKPPRPWKLGMPSNLNGTTLFRLSGNQKMAVLDCPVSNVAHSSGGGLQAHNYWDNEVEFITPVAAALSQLV